MTITGQLREIEPVYSSLREILRATFRCDGIDTKFIAYSEAASLVVKSDGKTSICIDATDRVTLLSNESAFLVNSAYLAPAI